MTNKLLRSVTIITLAGLALSATAWAIASTPRRTGRAVQTEGPHRKTLRDIARERDVKVEEPAEGLNVEYGDLRLLARHAEAIVVGRITDEESFFSSDDRIVTTYRLDVHRVVKDVRLNAPLDAGQAPPAPLVTTLKLVRPDVTVIVNGHRATHVLKGGERLKPGSDFLLFLWWSPNFNAYTLAGGVSGAFLIDGNRLLSPLGSRPGMLKYRGVDLQTVADEVMANQ